ncbi:MULTISPECIES: RNA polymerase sigma factor [unclassified Carboxylicivirga]|uniref:RNA polymerase sigma factor n=1 Tax=Carboxylicivirga TaxID=1628153 RepID=UPI003D3280C9
MNNANDIKNIKEIRAGDVSAFAQLIDRHQPMAFTLANSIVKNREEAEEVTQDAFFKAYKALSSFKGNAEFSTWLYRIVYNTAISKLRSHKVKSISLDVEEAKTNKDLVVSDDLKRLEQQERKIILKKALKQLKEDDAFIVILYYYKEQSIEEIADATGLGKSNIKVKLHRARKQMHDTLKRLLEIEPSSLF